MKSNWQYLGSIVLVAIALAAQARGQTGEAGKDPKPQDASNYLGTVQELFARQQVLQSEQLLTVELANALVSSNDLGIDVAEIQPALRAQLNLDEGTGLVITRAPDDSPGAAAGLKAHDVVVKVGEAAVGNTEQLADALKKADGKPVNVVLFRQGKAISVQATPKKPVVAEVVLSDTPLRAWFQTLDAGQDRFRIGVVFAEADDTLRAHLGLAAGEGLIVTKVFPDTPAAKMGIQPHDVVIILDGKRLTTIDAINTQIQEIKEREVELKLLRSGKEVTLKIAPAKEATAAYADLESQGLTIWHAGACPAQVKTFKCNSCHQDPFPDQHWKVERIHDYDILRRWIGQSPPATAGSPQQQVNSLKEQLAKMQDTLSTLEANLAAKNEKPAESKSDPEGKK
ncbi:MAG TPA: PDZ domain-containing protein [Pirellulaceae bacterium]|nr:PDZ domain-containing protein [Pirellulaceae bacterium]